MSQDEKWNGPRHGATAAERNMEPVEEKRESDER